MRRPRVALGGLLVALLPALPVIASGSVKVRARDATTSVDHVRLVQLLIEASHVALHWTGATDAHPARRSARPPPRSVTTTCRRQTRTHCLGQAFSDAF